MGWSFGFKLHLIINDKGEILNFMFTPGNVDDKEPLRQGHLGDSRKFEENPSSVRPFSRGKSRGSDDGISDGIRPRTDKGYAICYGNGQEKYGNSALTRKNPYAG